MFMNEVLGARPVVGHPMARDPGVGSDRLPACEY
jgi:hypothetical protein